jgi:hypothetical protein
VLETMGSNGNAKIQMDTVGVVGEPAEFKALPTVDFTDASLNREKPVEAAASRRSGERDHQK